MKICGASAALATLQTGGAGPLRAEDLRHYGRVKLTDEAGNPIKAGQLTTEEAHVFHYPFKGTPCFLINLGRPAAKKLTLPTQEQGEYVWPGGVGGQGEIVAYSAICAHLLSAPSRAASPITYREPGDKSGQAPGMIVCCTHNSVYDPAQGAKVVAGPAPQPLAAIRLEHDPHSDELYATGVYGGTMFDLFFTVYRRHLAATYGPSAGRQEASEAAKTVRLSEYSRTLAKCPVSTG